MHKFIGVILLATLFIIIAPKIVYASSIITIDKSGNVTLKVLSSETTALLVPKSGELEVKDVANTTPTSDAEINLEKADGKISLAYDGKTLDVTNWQDELVEIEERADVKKIKIGLENGRFLIQQEDYLVLTDFPIKLNPKENKFLLITPSGEKYLAILPFEAVQSILRTKYINKLSGNRFELNENNKDLAYSISGEKVISLLGLYDIKIPVSAKVSASTGEISYIDAPVWLKLIDFLLVQNG